MANKAQTTPKSQTDACPRCGQPMKPIVYGMVGSDAFEAAERGELFIGGCMVGTDDPSSRCTGCGFDSA